MSKVGDGFSSTSQKLRNCRSWHDCGLENCPGRQLGRNHSPYDIHSGPLPKGCLFSDHLPTLGSLIINLGCLMCPHKVFTSFSGNSTRLWNIWGKSKMRPGSWKLVRGNVLPPGRQVATWGRKAGWSLYCLGAGLWSLLPGLWGRMWRWSQRAWGSPPACSTLGRPCTLPIPVSWEW